MILDFGILRNLGQENWQIVTDIEHKENAS